MSTSTFAQELAARLVGNDQYWSLLATLQSKGVIETLHRKPADVPIAPSDLAKLLYCAEVFVQTEDESLHKQAQEIAIHTLLVSNHEDGNAPRERALLLLTELGNFPGLNYVERNLAKSTPSLLGLINRRVSEKLNTVAFGDESRALTAYQKRVWNSLHKTRAAVISAPTSAGKSFLVVEHLCRLAEKPGRFIAAYVTPTRALLSEVHQKVQARLKDRPDVRVSAIPKLEEEHIYPTQIFVLTQERLSTLLSTGANDLAFDLLVVDEAQNIADGSRGMILQDCLERIAERSNKTQVILLAPGAIGMPEVAKTFGIFDLASLSTQLSPVQQNRIVLTKVPRKPRELALAVIGREGARHELGKLELAQSLNEVKSRLALVAVELGGDGGSLLYETGPREAEKAAECLVELLKARGGEPSPGPLEELSKFIREHVHPDYQLAGAFGFSERLASVVSKNMGVTGIFDYTVGFKSAETRETQISFGPQHVPPLLWLDDYDRNFATFFSRMSPTIARRFCSMALVKLCGEYSWAQAARQLKLTEKSEFTSGCGLEALRQTGTLQEFAKALRKVAQRLSNDPDRIDYASRREVLSNFIEIPYEHWIAMCRDAGINPGRVGIRNMYAAIWLWAMLTGSEWKFAPGLVGDRRKGPTNRISFTGSKHKVYLMCCKDFIPKVAPLLLAYGSLLLQQNSVR